MFPGDLQSAPIQYVFVLMQENRSFDSYYGRFKAYLKDVLGAKDFRVDAYDPVRNVGGLDVPGTPYELRDCDGQTAQDQVLASSYDPRADAPFNAMFPGQKPKSAGEKKYWRHAKPGGLEQCVSDTCHEWWCSHLAWDSGRMDGFWAANDAYHEGGEPIVGTSLLTGDRALYYYDQTDIPFYYWLADQFAIGDRYFASMLGPTWPNRDYLYAATSRGVTSNSTTTLGNLYAGSVPASPAVRLNTLYDALKEKGVVYTHWVRRRFHVRLPKWGTWYGGPNAVFDLLSTRDYDALHTGETDEPGLEASVIIENEMLKKSHDDPLSKRPQGALPPVNFIDPDYLEDVNSEDEHPPGVPRMGQRHVFDVVRVLMANPEVWKRSVLFVTYDEGGGFYDHVDPPPACPPDDIEPTWAGFYSSVDGVYAGRFDRYGFRVPLLVVSPWAKRHHVSHVTFDHTSIVRFIEARFGLPALTRRDANAEPLRDFFDFSTPRDKLAGNAVNADRTTWGGEVLPLSFPIGPGRSEPAENIQWFGGPPGEKLAQQAYGPCVAAMPPAGVSSGVLDPRALGSNVWELHDWSAGILPPATYKPDVSRPFPYSDGGTGIVGTKTTAAARRRATTAAAGSCPAPPTTDIIRVKVITTISQDPNDLLADPLYNVHAVLGGTTIVVPSSDDVGRGTVGAGAQVIKFPKDNGLDDEKGAHLYRVGSINVHVTKDAGSGDRCKPVDQEGDVTFTFDPAAANPSSQSEYEIGIRIVPFDAPALTGGVECK